MPVGCWWVAVALALRGLAAHDGQVPEPSRAARHPRPAPRRLLLGMAIGLLLSIAGGLGVAVGASDRVVGAMGVVVLSWPPRWWRRWWRCGASGRPWAGSVAGDR
jgi:hypothetical protein